MATILLPTIGSSGDVFPMIGLGLELQRRGHHPVIMTNAHFAPMVTPLRLDFVPVGDEEMYRQVTANPDLWHPARSFNVVASFAIGGHLRPMYNAILTFDPKQTVVVASTFVFGARMAHETHGFPYASLHLQPGGLRSVIDPPIQGPIHFSATTPLWIKQGWFHLLDGLVIDRTLKPIVNPFRQELGLAPAQGFFADFLHAPQLSLGLFPDWFAPPPADWPPQVQLTGFVHYDGGAQQGMSKELLHFLDAGEPPLVWTPGTAMRLGQNFFAAALEATQLLGRRSIFVSSHREQIPSHLPDSIFHAAYVPFGQLLHRAAAMIHHGGIGTLAQTLAAGIPHLVMPMAHDQPDNARRLQRLGVGDSLLPKAFTPQAVAQKLERLLTDSAVHSRCRELAPRVDFADALRQSCDAIEGLIP